MRVVSKINYIILTFVLVVLWSLVPQVSIAQSEEDILNSIGNELDSEAAKKKEAERIDKEYNSLKPKADAAYKSGKYEKAKSYYAQMLKLKPDSDFASNRLALIDQKIAVATEEAAEKKYQSLIAQADALLAAEKWSESAEKYKAASAVWPDESYPKTQISKLQKLKTEAEASAKLAIVQEKYDKAIVKADQAKTSENWEVAKQQYSLASKTKPEETYPKTQLTEVDKLQKAAEALAAQKALDKKYTFLVNAGDKALEAKDWDVAKEKYNLAMQAKPNEAGAKSKYAKVDVLKAEYLAKQEQIKTDKAYKAKLVEADEFFNAKKWAESVVAYEQANKIKSAETYPSSQITKANGKITEEKDEQKKLAELETEYQKQIKVGEEGIANKTWEIAIKAFASAQALKPNNKSVSGLLNQAKAGKKSSDELALKEKAATEALVKKQKQYESVMASGQQAIVAKDWATAESAFNKAKSIKPEESAPDEKLTQLSGLIAEEKKAIEEEKSKKKAAAEMAAAEVAAAKAKKLEEEKAEKARIAEEARVVAEAKKEVELKKQEADRLAKEAEKADAAKKAEAEKLAAIAAKEAEVKEREEENLLAEQAAEEEARKVAEAKKSEKLRKQQEAERIKKEKELAQAQEAEAATLLAEKRQGFNLSVKKYLASINLKNWSEALVSLNSADKLLPNQPEVVEMRKELSSLQSSDVKRKAAELAKEEKLKEIDLEYQNLIKAGDLAMANGDYKKSKESYSKALSLKSNEPYPTNKIKELKELMLAENDAALAKQKELDKAYSSLLSEGEQAIAAKNWNLATQKFKEASSLKPDKQGPKERLNQVQLMSKEEQDLANRKKVQEEEYSGKMIDGQNALENKKYADAKRYFMGASKMKPNEEEPKKKLEETNVLWAEFVKAQKAVEKERLAQELDRRYNEFVQVGDNAVTSELWDDAIKGYQEALMLKPNEEYPLAQLNIAKANKTAAIELLAQKRKEEEARQIVLERERLKQEEEANKLAKLEMGFTKYMEQGDLLINVPDYKNAVFAYKKAVELKPEDVTAQSKLKQATEQYKIAEADRLAKEKERMRLAAIELKKKQEIAKKEREAYLAELMKNSPSELAKKYPNGLTEEIKEQDERVITKSIIVENGEGRYLVRFDYPWGEHFYYLNGKKIREDTYEWNIRKYKF